MSSISRTLGNLRKIGIKEYWHQLNYIGDTKAGTLVGTDKFGNKFYENRVDEIPIRTRWVDFKSKDPDSAEVEPLWHFWISHAIDMPPSQDPLMQASRPWAPSRPIPNYTQTRGAFKTYNTVRPKVSAWEPKAVERR